MQMSQIFITGDTHIPVQIRKLNSRKFPEQEILTKDDVVIVCGDFGGVWDNSNEEKYWIKWLNNKSFTTCFVDGNHESFDLLDAMPVELWNGGKIHRVSDSVIHLMRGQVFNINETKIFTMGGAESHDKMYRKEGVSWWSREMPSNEEYEEGLVNLDKAGWSVDYVITHCAPDSIQYGINRSFMHDRLTNYLETIKKDLNYKKWFCGHYHVDKEFFRFQVVYNDIFQIGT